MGYLYFDGRNCGAWDSAIIDSADRLGLKWFDVGHQQVCVQFKSWKQIPDLIPDCAIYRSIRIESQRRSD